MGQGNILESWKEIAAYLRRNVRTCQNWERELGLPVHRLDGSPKARVFAYPEELDRWLTEKLHERDAHRPNDKARRLIVPALALLGLAAAGAVVWRLLLQRAGPPSPNMENSIAVINFENQTGDKALDDYRKMIPSRLITSLEQTQSFYVTSTERIMDILKQVGKGGAEFIDSEVGFEVCRKDGVKSLVTGSFYRAGDTFFTDVRVLDVRTKRLLRTAKAQGAGPESLFLGQVDELSRQIATGLGVAKEKLDASLKPIGDVGTRSAEAYKYYLQGSKDLDNYQYPKARKSLEQAVEIDPEFAMAYSELGRAYYGEGDTPDSNQAFEKAHLFSKNATEKERLQIELAYAEQIERNIDKCNAISKEFATKYPKEKSAHAALGYMYDRSDPEKAIKEYSIALSLDPNHGTGLTNLGYIYLRRKEFTKALEYFRRLTIARPEDPNSFDTLAEGYFRAGKVAEAKATYLKLLEKWPGTYWSVAALAYINALEEDYGEGLRQWDKLLDVGTPGLKRFAYWWKGFYRGWIGDLNGSLSDLERAEEMFGTVEEKGYVAQIMWLRSWIYLDQHKLDLSRKSLEDCHAYTLEERPQYTALYDARYNEVLGHFECEEGKASSAELRWKEMEALLPKVAPASQESLKYGAGWLRAEVRLAQGRVNEVIGSLEKTPPRLQPEINGMSTVLIYYNVPFLKDALARAYAKKDDLDKAIAEYERLTTFDPKNDEHYLIHPKYHYRLGLLYEQKGLKAKAAERYRKFLGLWKAADPGLPEVSNAKKRLATLTDR